jgi:formamidopyrimidine-DNA glycosylase
MDEALRNRAITEVEALQEKCLNVSVADFKRRLVGCSFQSVERRGKWLIMRLKPECFLLLNLGMGADLWRYGRAADIPAKYQLRVGFDDGSGFTCRFWWFGYIRLLTADELAGFKEVVKLGPSPLEIGAEEFASVVGQHSRKTAKDLIVNQEIVSGIGNAYAHDILWKAGLHPKRKAATLTAAETRSLYDSIAWVMKRAIEKGGIEPDFHHAGGNMKNWDALGLVGYKRGKPCPKCATSIEEIKTGATKTFICPKCQTL